MRRALLVTILLLLSVVIIKSQCVGTGCPGSSGGSPATTVPSAYKYSQAPSLANFASIGSQSITACTSKLCQCTFSAFTATNSGNGRFSITYKDSQSGATVSTGNLSGTQTGLGGVVNYVYLMNSGNAAPTFNLLNGDVLDTFDINVACYIIN